MEFEGRVLSDKKALEAVLARCIPVVTDNHYQVTENPRNKDLFEQTERWGGLVFLVAPDRKTYVGINYSKCGTVENFLKEFDAACKQMDEKAPPEK